ncbi:ParB/RepB/Spo0J family partition protein [Dyella japonica]|uniref:ParB/RepB/Spo0J family partition protein n=1 Tax=Dyella japonica TaxID=231455 RepID=UPI0006998795|nr:ParB/RepB/Spo0J family partition protein [Dyella japonica]
MTSDIRIIPLDQLHSSTLNPRRTGEISFEDLVASIAAHGLLQNLVVSPREAGGFDVRAGGRRRAAIGVLSTAGRLPADLHDGVPCKVISAEGAGEAALAENVVRQDMHPADEFDAFSSLSQQGKSVAEIAARFGKEEIYVRQRLRLANIAPDLLQEYRDGKAELDQMMALALTDDQAMQVRVWKAAKHEWARDPEQLRAAITKSEMSINSKLGKFVGIEAYEAAGGVVRRDLFPSDDGPEAYFTDPELVHKVAQAKLEKTATKIAKEGWLWVEARPKFDFNDERVFGDAPYNYKGNKKVYDPAVIASAGAVVTIDFNGHTEVKRGLVRPADRKSVTQAAGGAPISGGKAPKATLPPGTLSFAATQRLQAEATAIVQSQVADTPAIALALLAAELACSVFAKTYDADYRTWICIRREHGGRIGGDHRAVVEASAAGKRMKELEDIWRELMPTSRSGIRTWVMMQDPTVVQKLLTFLIAREIEAVDVQTGQKNGVTKLAQHAEVNLADHWTPTQDWLAGLSRKAVVEMVREAAGKVAAAKVEKASKGEIPSIALAEIPPGWLPKALRAPKAKQAKAVAND